MEPPAASTKHSAAPKRRLPRSFPLRVRGDHVRLSIFVPARHFVLGGLLLLILPVFMVAVAVPLVVEGDDLLFVRDLWWGARAIYALFAAFVITLAIAGTLRLVLARRWSRRLR